MQCIKLCSHHYNFFKLIKLFSTLSKWFLNAFAYIKDTQKGYKRNLSILHDPKASSARNTHTTDKYTWLLMKEATFKEFCNLEKSEEKSLRNTCPSLANTRLPECSRHFSISISPSWKSEGAKIVFAASMTNVISRFVSDSIGDLLVEKKGEKVARMISSAAGEH